MSRRAVDFVEEWIAENVQGQPFVDDEGEDLRPAEFALSCISAAGAAGITEQDIWEEYPDLVDRMADAINESAEEEVSRLAAKAEPGG